MRTLPCIVAISAILLYTFALAATTASASHWPDSSRRQQFPFFGAGQGCAHRPQQKQSQQELPLEPIHDDPIARVFTPQRQTLQLQHILAHGAPYSKSAKVFRRLDIDDETRFQMTFHRNSLLDTEADGTKSGSGSTFQHTLSDAYFPLHDEDDGDGNVVTEPSVESRSGLLPRLPWTRVPDAKDHGTVVSMIRMALDCYVDPKRQGWVDIGDNWDVDTEIGWLEAGLRGYVFASEDKKTVVIGIKGTSLKLFGTGGGPTGNNDKMNDNKMFSCCCGKVDRTWWPVCGCYMGGDQCNQQCLVNDLQADRDEGKSYYSIGLKVLEATKNLFPDANIWLTGHSLGGSVASTIGITKGYPTFTFQSPGDVRFAQRMSLVKPELSEHDLKKLPIWQFGHTADPVFMGTCNGPVSTCYSAGYALETKCHLGKTCIYDTVSELGWRQTIQAHTIFTFINVVENWQNMTQGREIVAPCLPQTDCQDCTQWNFV